MPSITIDQCVNDNGILRVTYSKTGLGGGNGHGWSYPVASLSLMDLDLNEDQLFRTLVTWARRKGLTPAQMVGAVVTIDLNAATNIVTITTV